MANVMRRAFYALRPLRRRAPARRHVILSREDDEGSQVTIVVAEMLRRLRASA
jgi:hypothetical protein